MGFFKSLFTGKEETEEEKQEQQKQMCLSTTVFRLSV